MNGRNAASQSSSCTTSLEPQREKQNWPTSGRCARAQLTARQALIADRYRFAALRRLRRLPTSARSMGVRRGRAGRRADSTAGSDVVRMDIRMPVLNGISATRECRGRCRT